MGQTAGQAAGPPAPIAHLPEAVDAGAARSTPGLGVGLHRGIRRTCPACGKGALFCGYLAVRPTCPRCGNDNDQYPSDDFAPYVTMFIVLHAMVPLLITADHHLKPGVWLEALIAVPLFMLATLALLPFVKGGVIGFAWAFGVTRDRAGVPD